MRMIYCDKRSVKIVISYRVVITAAFVVEQILSLRSVHQCRLVYTTVYRYRYLYTVVYTKRTLQKPEAKVTLTD
jgi:hypothetical protein